MKHIPLISIVLLCAAASLSAQTPPPTPRRPHLAVPDLPDVPSGTSNFGMGLSCSNCTISFSEHYAAFTKPPAIYSVERGGPADKAGLQRGDLITHVNGLSITTREGGTAFGRVRPGDIVKFTVLRNNQYKTLSLRAEKMTPPPMLAMPSLALSNADEALDNAGETLDALQRTHGEQLRRAQMEAARTMRMQETELREVQRRMVQQQADYQRRLEALSAQMERAQAQMRRALGDSTGVSCVVSPALAPTAARARTLRYSGTLGNADIEVRGASPVEVTETPDEVVITTGGTVVKVQKKK